MTNECKRKTAAPKPKRAPKTMKAAAASKKPAGKKSASRTGAKALKTPGKSKAASAKKTGAPAAKTKKGKAKVEAARRIARPVAESLVDPIGDVTSGEARTYLGDDEPLEDAEPEGPANVEAEAYRAETAGDALEATLNAAPELAAAAAAAANEVHGSVAEEDETEAGDEPHPPAKLERLQKILSQAGIASRRHAEEMIVAGRVVVNGQVVTTLGSKADPARDHIRVDGKLLHGAERHRYFMLNKPKGFVTTVSDPEGRPTVMEFFTGFRERLYPVGRLDYLSEGLLLMTNDGELANLLTNAGSGVEKTYLVKVAGQPSEEELARLRSGVAIERGEAGSERVRTAPARVRQVREGDNPWYEVVLTEGRNRELRKMFSAVGHFVEKIRRVGYGPLVLDVEPGKLRELTQEEVTALRLTAEGKIKPRRPKTPSMMPKVTPTVRNRPLRRDAGRTAEKRDRPQGRSFDRSFDRRPNARPERGENRFGGAARAPFKPRSERPDFRGAPRQDRGEVRFGGASRAPFKPRGERPEFRGAPRQDRGENRFGSASRAPFKARGERPEFRGAPRQDRGESRFGGAARAPFKPRGERPEFRPAPRQDRSENRFGGASRAPFKPRGERPDFRSAPRQDRGEAKPHIEIERVSDFRKGPEVGGKPKPSFGRKPGFRGKPGGFARDRGKGAGGAKHGGSRPGAQRGGWKRG